MGAYLPDFTLLLPELFLFVTSLLILGEGVLKKEMDSFHLTRLGIITFLSLMIAFGILVLIHKPLERLVSFSGQVLQDDFVFLAKSVILLGSLAIIGISTLPLIREKLLSFEYFSLMLWATIGMLLMVAANDFLSLFIGLEIQGLSLYVLAALDRDHLRASEAALKYFILGAFATACYLYGTSFIYGFSGSTNFEVVSHVIDITQTTALPIGLMIGLIFILASLGFKVSAAPFHMWTPDVYQGCPTPITAFMAALPKIAGMIILLRLMTVFSPLYGDWQALLSGLSILSMVIGTFAALRQTNLKRLMAYSAVAQMGYILMGIAAGNEDGVQAVFLSLILYLIMIIGVFGCLLCLRGKGSYSVETIDDLSGLATLHPRTSFILSLFMFSLAGIPPLSGFFSKIYVFKAALTGGLFGLAVIGVLTSVVAAYYYLRVVKVMYFDDVPESPPFTYGQTIALSGEMAVLINTCACITLFFFFYPNPLLKLIRHATLVLLQ